MAKNGGQFQKGNKANPGGRRSLPPELFCDLKDLTSKCVPVYEKALSGDDQKLALMAAESLLSRLYGRPAQQVDLGGQENNPIKMVTFYIPDNGRGGTNDPEGSDGTSGESDTD